MKNKSFLIGTFVITTVLFLGQISFNYFFDSYGFFRKNTNIDTAAKAIANGHMLSIQGNYDERIFQQRIIEHFTKKPQQILIGSSRSMMIPATFFEQNNRFFNHSVSGASIEDYIAILGLYEKHNLLPKTVILGIDPWIFNKNNHQQRWKSLNESYTFMMSKLNKDLLTSPSSNTTDRYAQLINFENTKNNLLHLKETLKKETNFKVTATDQIDTMIKKPDGSILYPFKIRYKKDSDTLTEAKAYIAGAVYSVEDFHALSNTQLFEDLIGHLQNHGVTVVFFLPPYHPTVYHYLANNPKYHNILKAENYVRTFAQQKNITLLGSYNPDIYHFRSNDFTDGMHAKESVAKRIFNPHP